MKSHCVVSFQKQDVLSAAAFVLVQLMSYEDNLQSTRLQAELCTQVRYSSTKVRSSSLVFFSLVILRQI